MLTSRRALFVVLGLSVSLSLYGITWGLPDPRGWAPDEILPSQVLDGMKTYFSFGWHYTYPALHFIFLALCYLPWIKLHELGYLQGDPTFTLFLVGRGLTVLMSVGALFFLYQCARRLYNEWVGVIAVLLLSLTPQFVYYSKTVNLDIPSLFWFLWSMIFYVKIIERNRNQMQPGKLGDYCGLAVTAAFAVCTKDQAAGMYLTVPPLLIYSELLAKRLAGSSVTRPQILLRTIFSKQNIAAAGIALVLFAVLHNLLFNWEGFLKHLDIIIGKESRARYYMFENTLAGHWGLFDQVLRSYLFCLGLPALFLCSVGVFIDWRERRWQSNTVFLLTSSVVFYWMIIRPILYSVDRYFLPIVAFLAIFGGYAAVKLSIAAQAELNRAESEGLSRLARLWRTCTPRLVVLLLGGIIGWSFLRANSINLLMVNDSRYAVEAWFRENVKPHAAVYYYSRNYYLPRLRGYQLKTGHATLAHLGTIKDAWIVLSAKEINRFKRRNKAFEFYRRMLKGSTHCQLKLRYQSHPGLNVLNPPFDLTNLAKVNPDLWVFFCP